MPDPARATTSDLFARIRALVEKGRMPNGDQPMFLATASAEGVPSARTVLLKAQDGRGFVFYTNLKSHKGSDLLANACAELLFYWPALETQLRIAGKAETVEDAVADAYWRTRDRESQLASAASPQSSPCTREEVLAKIDALRRACEGKDVPRPAHWTGFRVVPESVEFWHAGGNHRVHDRERWTRTSAGADTWERKALAP